MGQPHAPTERIRQAPPGQGRPPEAVPPHLQQQATQQINTSSAIGQRPGHTPPGSPPKAPPYRQVAPAEEPVAPKKKRRLRDPLSILLIFIIVVALLIGGVVGLELWARHTADSKVAQAVACEVRDQATAKFGVTPLLLYQLATDHYTNISVETAGNQIRDAQGMKLKININDVRINKTSASKGTIGSLDATVTWTTDGIKQTVQKAIPVLGAFVTNTVTTDPKDGTIELKGMLNDIKAKPVVSNGGLSLQIVTFNTLGFSMPKESVQSTLDEFLDKQTKNYPLGIHADSVEVTSSGITSHFSTQNATIPAGGNDKDTCFSNV
jgi:LmeA-like phospholipid-binding